MRLSSVFRFARPSYVWRGQRGFCAVCARATYFLVTCEPALRRDDAFCVWCGSVSRQRHLALAVVEAFSGLGVRTFREVAERADVAIWHTSARGPIAAVLRQAHQRAVRAAASSYTALAPVFLTDFFDGVPSGMIQGGVICEDLQATTFDDDRFDLVITEDVLEHVADYQRALRELRRVLKPGGCHVFTVPYYPDEQTQRLFAPSPNGDRPTAARTRFGADLAHEMEACGFRVVVRQTSPPEIRRHATHHCTTFIARKGAI